MPLVAPTKTATRFEAWDESLKPSFEARTSLMETIVRWNDESYGFLRTEEDEIQETVELMMEI